MAEPDAGRPVSLFLPRRPTASVIPSVYRAAACSFCLRQLPDGGHAVASLIANQASHVVVAALADHMAAQAQILGAEILIGLPPLGLVFASLVAERLGQPRYVPLGYSRKFWYDDALSEPVSSITTPDPSKRLRLDPNLLTLIKGPRVALVDDAISTVRLLQAIGVEGWS